MVKVGEIRYGIPLPEGVKAELQGHSLSVTGPSGSLERVFRHPKIDVSVDTSAIVLYSALPRRRVAALAGTWRSHITNMVVGVTEGFKYELKIRYSHFPMKVAVKGDQLMIENFMGERHPRKARILHDTKIDIKKDDIIVTGMNKEHVGQTAANIELATRIKRYDPRVFQDGIYIVQKG